MIPVMSFDRFAVISRDIMLGILMIFVITLASAVTIVHLQQEAKPRV